MKIYTKTGDSGTTSLFGGKRVPKNSPLIEAYGTVDELNSQLGYVRSLQPSPEIDDILARIQHKLFTLGADLATPMAKKSNRIKRIKKTDVVALEETIDQIQARLEPLKAFILPGGSQVGAQLHVARTICRRAERLVATLTCKKDASVHALVYLNRLSDLFFVLARRANALAKETETLWNGK
jgi:cob(I)alamin adenosyltransferase